MYRVLYAIIFGARSLLVSATVLILHVYRTTVTMTRLLTLVERLVLFYTLFASAPHVHDPADVTQQILNAFQVKPYYRDSALVFNFI